MIKKPTLTMRTRDGSAVIYIYKGGKMSFVADQFIVASDQKTLDATRALREGE